MKRLLIDATNVAHIHFAANPALDANGNPAGIIKGFLGAVKSINRTYRPSEIVCFWDGPGGSLQRRGIYKGYKGGRKPRSMVGQHYQFSSPEQAERNYDWQTDEVRKLLNYCGICSIVTENYETDDGIAYIIKTNPDDEHLIVSCDKDFYQLVSEKTKIYNPIMKRTLDIDWILNKYEIHPSNWLFFRSITGDASDNIGGVKGFGPKTLKKLFDLNLGEIKFKTEDISEAANLMLLEEKLTPKEKTIKKRLTTLKDSLDIIDRNWGLMDLRNPLMSIEHQRKVDFQISDHHPALNQKDFYIEMVKLDLGINTMMPNDFVKLRR